MRAKSVLRTAEPSARATQRGASVARKKKEAARRARERATQQDPRDFPRENKNPRAREGGPAAAQTAVCKIWMACWMDSFSAARILVRSGKFSMSMLQLPPTWA